MHIFIPTRSEPPGLHVFGPWEEKTHTAHRTAPVMELANIKSKSISNYVERQQMQPSEPSYRTLNSSRIIPGSPGNIFMIKYRFCSVLLGSAHRVEPAVVISCSEYSHFLLNSSCLCFLLCSLSWDQLVTNALKVWQFLVNLDFTDTKLKLLRALFQLRVKIQRLNTDVCDGKSKHLPPCLQQLNQVC